MEKTDGLKYLIVSDGHEFRRQRKLHGFRGKEEDYLDLISYFNSLEKYSLCGLNFEKSIVLNSILQNGKSLKVLDLAHCQSLNLQRIEKIITNCVQLTEVNFDNTDLTESALNFICRNISPSILKLSLQELKVSDENISILVKRCQNITELALIGTNISDMGVTAIQENLSQTLVSIGLPNEISEIRASNFIKSMPNLKKLWYWNNYPISSLESQCPNLTQNGSWHQEIGVPGHGDSIWEIKCKPTNSFPRRQDLMEHEKEVKKFIRNCYL